MLIQKISPLNYNQRTLSFKSNTYFENDSETTIADSYTYTRYEDLINLLAKNKCISNVAGLKKSIDKAKAIDTIKNTTHTIEHEQKYNSKFFDPKLIEGLISVGHSDYYSGREQDGYQDVVTAVYYRSKIVDALELLRKIGAPEDAKILKNLSKDCDLDIKLSEIPQGNINLGAYYEETIKTLQEKKD